MDNFSLTPARAGTLQRLLGKHPFFAEWDADRLRAIEQFCQIVDAPGTATLVELDDLQPFDYFLLDGDVELQSKQGDKRQISAGELDAGFPIAHLRPSQYRVVVADAARLLRIETSQLKKYAAARTPERSPSRYHETTTSVGGTWRGHALVVDVMRGLRDGSLPVPSVPGIAQKIRRAMAKDDVSMDDVATIISADPAIAARLIKVSNSALFGAASGCETVQAALVRLGMARVQNIVFTLATRNLFVATQSFIKDRMLSRWRHAIDIAALSAVLGKLATGLDGDKALLAGLLHEIGAIPILRLAANHPDFGATPGLLDEIVDGLAPEVSAAVLERWEFSQDLVNAAAHQRDWFYQHEGGADYSDMLIVAHLHALARQREARRLPRLDETPAFQKLELGDMTSQLSLQVLDEARVQIQELKGLLT